MKLESMVLSAVLPALLYACDASDKPMRPTIGSPNATPVNLAIPVGDSSASAGASRAALPAAAAAIVGAVASDGSPAKFDGDIEILDVTLR
jgi:hypothetical protein